ncbi:MAG: LapA family protein [Burkholderiaceae bacterium]|jgi:uncharacterized integral membrane protein|nr:LapA family protein [Burkholderiaceae bacterium]
MIALRRLLTWIKWIIRAAIFGVLFAFAVNNQQQATLHLLFDREWRAPMTLIVLAAFALGLIVGVLGMLPGRWRHAKAQLRTSVSGQPSAPAAAQSAPESVSDQPYPSRGI